MRVSIALIALILSGCEAPSASQDPSPKTETESPSSPVTPTVTPPAFSGRSMFSTWAMSDNAYSVDLSGIAHQKDPSGNYFATGTPVFVFGVQVALRCHASTVVIGNESAGSLTISGSYSETGSASANNAYCHPINGLYQYTRIDDQHLQLCRAVQGCVIWAGV